MPGPDAGRLHGVHARDEGQGPRKHPRDSEQPQGRRYACRSTAAAVETEFDGVYLKEDFEDVTRTFGQPHAQFSPVDEASVPSIPFVENGRPQLAIHRDKNLINIVRSQKMDDTKSQVVLLASTRKRKAWIYTSSWHPHERMKRSRDLRFLALKMTTLR